MAQYETGLATTAKLSETWKIPFKDQDWEMADHFMTHLIRKLQVLLALMQD
jgi:hypothetical protein